MESVGDKATAVGCPSETVSFEVDALYVSDEPGQSIKIDIGNQSISIADCYRLISAIDKNFFINCYRLAKIDNIDNFLSSGISIVIDLRKNPNANN